MKRQVHIEITVDYDGNAVIQIPHKKNQQRDANAAADFTLQFSEALGTIEERHIGDHEHHHSDFAPDNRHVHHHH